MNEASLADVGGGAFFTAVGSSHGVTRKETSSRSKRFRQSALGISSARVGVFLAMSFAIDGKQYVRAAAGRRLYVPCPRVAQVFLPDFHTKKVYASGERERRIQLLYLEVMLSVNTSPCVRTRVLFENVTCTFMRAPLAVTGPNGAGKSTFMRFDWEIDRPAIDYPGEKEWRFLRQDQFAFDEYRVIDTVIMGNVSLWKALEERDALMRNRTTN